MRGAALLGRAGLIAGGLVAGVLLLEGALQATAAIMAATGRESPESWLTNSRRVLSVGDSNTYGLWLERHESYPRQLEALWNESVEQPKLEVINLGFPGTNSSRVVRDFDRLLTVFAPDLLILMVGVNDFWTLPLEVEDPQRGAGGKGFLQRHSLVYKLYFLIVRSFDARKLEIDERKRQVERGGGHIARFGDEEFDMGFIGSKKGNPDGGQALEENLNALIARARAFDVPLYLMTYPGRFRFYAKTNPVIRKVGKETETPVIDLTTVFEPLCPRLKCPGLLFPDQHPTARGYRIVAEAIIEELKADDAL